MKDTTVEWQLYRTRFLIKAEPLTQAMSFIDGLGREHRGGPGDYLIESSDGSRSIQRREIFEDIYVPWVGRSLQGRRGKGTQLHPR